MLQAVEQQLAALDLALANLLEQLPLFRVRGLLQRFAGNLGARTFGAEQVLQQLGFAFRCVQRALRGSHIAISCRLRVSQGGGSGVRAAVNAKGR